MDSTQKNKREISQKFMDTLLVVHQHFFRPLAIPLPANHFAVLIVLKDGGPITITAVGKLLLMSKQQMTPIIDKLVKSGFIARKTMPEDRRCTEISLTLKGKRLLAQNDDVVRERLENGLTMLTPEESLHFGHSLDVFSTSIMKMFGPVGERS